VSAFLELQDAHELLLDLLNDVSELLEAEHKRTGSVAGADNLSLDPRPRPTPYFPLKRS